MNDERRVMLEAIAYGDDKRTTPADRLRAIEQLGPDEQGDRFAHLTDEALDKALADYMAPGWMPPPDPGQRAGWSDELALGVVAAISAEDQTTRYPRTTERVAALAEAMLPHLDQQRVQAEVERRVAEELRRREEPEAEVVLLDQHRPSASARASGADTASPYSPEVLRMWADGTVRDDGEWD